MNSTTPLNDRLNAMGGAMEQGSTEKLMAQLDGAKLVKYDSSGYLLAWFGGHVIHAYDAGGVEVGYWNTGDFAQNDADVKDIEQSMSEHILSDEAYPY